MAPKYEGGIDGMVTVRAERPEDYAAISEVLRLAFKREVEANLVGALRKTKEFLPKLSLVALKDGVVVGHIMFHPIKIHTEGQTVPALILAPLSVRPEFQDAGIGSVLMRQGLAQCRELGNRLVIVVGHPGYYPKFGFVQAMPKGLKATFKVPSEVFMVLELVPGAMDGIHGLVECPPEFDGV